MASPAENTHYITDPNEKPWDGRGDRGKAEREQAQAEAGNDADKTEGDEARVTTDDGRVVLVKDDPELDAKVHAAMTEMDELDNQAAELTASRAEIIARLEAEGVNRDSFRYARKVVKMDPKKREGLDLSYLICRRAMGSPVQKDFFKAE